MTNINPSVTPDAMKSFFEKRDKESAPIKDADTSLEGWDTKRFCLTFKQKFFDKIMQTDFWPNGLYFKQYYPPRGGQKVDQTKKIIKLKMIPSSKARGCEILFFYFFLC